MKKFIKKNEKVVIVVCAATIAFLIIFTIANSALKSTMEGNITTIVGSTRNAKESLDVPTFAPIRAKNLQQTERTTKRSFYSSTSPVQTESNVPVATSAITSTLPTTQKATESPDDFTTTAITSTLPTTQKATESPDDFTTTAITSTLPTTQKATESPDDFTTTAITSTLPTTQKATERPDDFTSNAVNSKTAATNSSAPVSSLSITFTATTKVESTTPKAPITTKSPDAPNFAAHQAVTARATSTTTVQPPLNWRFYLCAKDSVSKDYIKKCSEFPRKEGMFRCLKYRRLNQCPPSYNGFA